MASLRQFRGLTNIALLGCFAFVVVCWWYLRTDAAASTTLQQNAVIEKKAGSPYGAFPFAASWSTWFNPQSWKDSTIARQGGKIDQNWNIFYHLGGTGPWVQKIDGVVTNDISPPPGCKVEQVHMLSRHGERFPTKNAGARITEVVDKLSNASPALKGDFAFIGNWRYFVDDPEAQLEQLTSTGPFSGTLESFTTGVKLRTRYRHLLPKHKSTKLWATDSHRVESTARYLAGGLFGLPLNEHATIEIIPEAPARGADTLTPSETCTKYRQDELAGHDYGNMQLRQWQDVYLSRILQRFQASLGDHSNVSLSLDNIYAMQEMCGYETTIRGKSPWCDLFAVEEWQAFEYARDLYHYYRSGPGNKYSRTMGTTWLNATSRLLSIGPSAGPMFISFSHDSDMIPTFTLLDLFVDDSPLPTTHVLPSRSWKMSQVVPMGGRLIIERLVCTDTSTPAKQANFVRLNINDGIVALPHCTSGPGSSCPLEEYLSIIESRLMQAPDFRSLCGLLMSAPDSITFLRQ